jgi:hypothetical protein
MHMIRSKQFRKNPYGLGFFAKPFTFRIRP